jgi:hypothetical protein
MCGGCFAFSVIYLVGIYVTWFGNRRDELSLIRVNTRVLLLVVTSLAFLLPHVGPSRCLLREFEERDTPGVGEVVGLP